MTLRFEPVDLDDVPWDELDALGDRTVWQQRPWLAFLATTQRARPLVAAVHDGPTTVAWFTGAKVRRAGVPILGSPLRGWTTSYQGFNLTDPGFDRVELASALRTWAFGPLRCLHVELLDRRINEIPAGPGWSRTTFGSWELELTPDPETLLSATSASCRAVRGPLHQPPVRGAVRGHRSRPRAPEPLHLGSGHRSLTCRRRRPVARGSAAHLVGRCPRHRSPRRLRRHEPGTTVTAGPWLGAG